MDAEQFANAAWNAVTEAPSESEAPETYINSRFKRLFQQTENDALDRAIDIVERAWDSPYADCIHTLKHALK